MNENEIIYISISMYNIMHMTCIAPAAPVEQEVCKEWKNIYWIKKS